MSQNRTRTILPPVSPRVEGSPPRRRVRKVFAIRHLLQANSDVLGRPAPARPFPKCLQPGPQPRPPLLRAMACMAVAVGLYLPLISWISSKTQVLAAERAETACLFVNPDECRPEPG